MQGVGVDTDLCLLLLMCTDWPWKGLSAGQGACAVMPCREGVKQGAIGMFEGIGMEWVWWEGGGQGRGW